MCNIDLTITTVHSPGNRLHLDRVVYAAGVQLLRVYPVADGAAVQDVEGRHPHHWAPGTPSRAATDWPSMLSNTSMTTSRSR